MINHIKDLINESDRDVSINELKYTFLEVNLYIWDI